MKSILLTALVAVGLAHVTAPGSRAGDTIPVLTREMAIDRVVAATPALDALRENINARTSTIRQAGVKPNPLLSTELENFTGTGPFTGLGRSEFTVAYNQRFERGGKRRSRVQLATNEKQIAIAQLQINRLDIIRETERAYIGVLAAQAKLENAEEQVTVFESIHDAINVRMARGKDSKFAVQNARMHLLRAQNRVTQAEQSVTNAKQSLSSLWQQTDTMFSVTVSSFFALPDHLIAPALTAAQSGPDLALWKLRQERSKSTVALEKANAVQDPTVKVGLRYLQGTSDVAAIVGVSIPFALYDTNSGNIGKAKANHKKSQYELSEAERQLERRILMQQNNRAAAYVQARQIFHNLIPEAEETKKLVLERLKRGVASYLDVFTTQTLAAEFKGQLLAELEQYHLAQIELDRLTARHGLDDTISDENSATDKISQNGEGK